MTDKSSVVISVIIPVFNTEQYLRPCLESIINQSLREIEIICVNDGSNDNSLSILREYAEKDKRLIIIDKKNEGQAIARNTALSRVSGEYIVFVDSDDHIDADLCRKVYDFAKKNSCDVAMYDFLSFKDINEISKKGKIPSILSTVSDLDKKELLRQMGVVWTKCVRSDFIRSNKIRFPEGRIYEDIFVHWQLVLLARTIGILPEKLYHYRIQPTATTFRTDWKITDRIFIFDMIHELLVSKNLYQEYRDAFLQSQLEVFWWLYDNIAPDYKYKTMELIQNRLGKEHWAYIDSAKNLSWKIKDFFGAIHGSRFAKSRRALWFFIRNCYRYIKRLINILLRKDIRL